MRMKDSENEAIEGEDLEKLNSNLLSIEQLCGVRIDREKDIIQQLNILVDQLCSLYTEDETEELTIRLYGRRIKPINSVIRIIRKRSGFLLKILQFLYHLVMMQFLNKSTGIT